MKEGYVQLTPEDDSPYPEVRASVPNRDDASLPQNTIRMWTIGMFMTTVGCALNVLFSLHSPVFSISSFVSAIVAWPLGRLWERFVPNYMIFGLPLNPGPFNIKEHALITIMSNVSFGQGAAYMTDIIITLNHFYGVNLGLGFQTVAILASQAIGFSMAGLVRRVLVYPASMIWPSNLVSSTFLTNIHINVNHKANGWNLSRLRFFVLILAFSFVWTWIPQYFAPFLSNFAFASWIAPNNVIVNQLFGTQSGLAMMPLTFDWNQIAGYVGSPLVPPYFAIANVFGALVLMFWLVGPIIQYTNVWFGHFLPMASVNSYDRYQQIYDVSRILSSKFTFDADKYAQYSPLYLPTTYALAFCLAFGASTATLVHAVLFDGPNILYYWRHSRDEPDDVHMRLMKRYPEVPDWWFLVCFFAFFALAVASVRAWDTDLPVWALLVALVLAAVMLIPVALVAALADVPVGLNVISEFIVGYMVPGRPIAMMLFKTYGYITNSQAVTFLSDMKLGHYLKIAPKVLFSAQLVATIWGSLVQLVTINWAQKYIPNVCAADQAGGFTCPQGRVFFNSSVVWGVIGPQRQFSPGQLYDKTLYFFLLGALLPLASWLILRRWPRSPVRHIHWPVFFNGTGLLPPATPYNFAAYCIVGHIFGYWIKRRWFNWWAKYNYSLSAGMDLGLALGTLMIFLISFAPGAQGGPRWWGSVGAFDNADVRAEPLVKLQPGQAFGPEKW